MVSVLSSRDRRAARDDVHLRRIGHPLLRPPPTPREPRLTCLRAHRDWLRPALEDPPAPLHLGSGLNTVILKSLRMGSSLIATMKIA